MLISARALRTAGWGLIAYGVIGLLLLALVVFVGAGPLATAESLLASLGGTLDAAADTARSSSTALVSVDSGLGAARTSTEEAGTLVADAAATSNRLADAMSLTILGTQPLVGLAADFRSIAEQLSSVGGSLEQVSAALETSTSDLAAVRDDVDRLALEIEAVRGAATDEDGGGDVSLRLAYYGLLAWLVLPAIGALIIGWSLLRVARGILINPPAA